MDPGRGVQIFNYVQQGSVDGFMWNGIEKKSESIKAIVRRHVTEREMEDVDELTADAATLKALASDDPMALEMVEAEQRFRGLELEKRTYDRNKATARDRIRAWQGTVERLTTSLPTWREDAAAAMRALENKPADFSMSVGRATYDKRADANAALADLMRALPFKGEWLPLGHYLGWTLYGRNEDRGYRVAVDNPLSSLGLIHPAPSVAAEPENTDFALRAENILKSLPATTKDQAERLSEAEKGIAVAETEALKPFRKSMDLAMAEREFHRLRSLMLGVEPGKEEAYEIREDETAAEVLGEATEEELNAARREVSEQALIRLRDGRDFVFPTPEEVEKASAALVVQRRLEAAAARAMELAAADEGFTATPRGPVSQETPAADLEAVAEATAETVDDALEKDVPVRLTARDIDAATVAPPSGVIGAAAQKIEKALEDNKGPFAVVVADTTQAPSEPAVVATPGPKLDDFTPEEKGEVIDRAADWVADEMDRQAEDGETAVITVADTDAMILQEVKDELVDRDGAVDLPVAEPVESVEPTGTDNPSALVYPPTQLLPSMTLASIGYSAWDEGPDESPNYTYTTREERLAALDTIIKAANERAAAKARERRKSAESEPRRPLRPVKPESASLGPPATYEVADRDDPLPGYDLGHDPEYRRLHHRFSDLFVLEQEARDKYHDTSLPEADRRAWEDRYFALRKDTEAAMAAQDEVEERLIAQAPQRAYSDPDSPAWDLAVQQQTFMPFLKTVDVSGLNVPVVVEPPLKRRAERRLPAEPRRPLVVPPKPTPSSRRLVEAGPSLKAAAHQEREKSVAAQNPAPVRKSSRQRPRDVARGAEEKAKATDKKISNLSPLARLALKKHGLR